MPLHVYDFCLISSASHYGCIIQIYLELRSISFERIIRFRLTHVLSIPASPVFFADNAPVQIGQYGTIGELTIKVYDKTYNSKLLIKNAGTTVRTMQSIENITTYDTFHGAKIRVYGIQYTIRMHLTSSKDFTNYTVEACNNIGCNHFHVLVQSASKLTQNLILENKTYICFRYTTNIFNYFQFVNLKRRSLIK